MIALAATSFIVGYVAVRIYDRMRLPVVPPEPKCAAMLVTGERCVHPKGHDGPHMTHASMMPGYSMPIYQTYCWEDPACGLHNYGFFIQPRK